MMLTRPGSPFERNLNPGNPVAWYRADDLTASDLTYNTTALTAQGLTGATALTFSATTGLQTGMYIRIDDAITGETFAVTSIVGTTVNIDSALQNTYAPGTAVFFGCVGTFTDRSGNGNHLVQGTGTAQPRLIKNYLNGHKALYFDGVDDVLRVAFALSQPYTLYMLISASPGGNQFIFDGFTAQNIIRLDSSIPSEMQVNAGANMRITYGGLQNLITARFNGPGSYGDTSFAQGYGSIGTNTPGGITLFGRFSNLEKGLGYCMEVKVYPAPHSIPVINKVRGEIKTHYGI